MATAVYDVLEIELQDGTVVEIRPLDLKRLRKVMKIIDEMNKPPEKPAKTTTKTKAAASGEEPISEDKMLEYLIAATKVSLEKQLPDKANDNEWFEEALDVPTIWKILEISAGISNNANLTMGAGLPGQA